MSDLNDIGQQLTPGDPTEITFGTDESLASETQKLVIIGHRTLSPTGSASNYKVVEISNPGDVVGTSLVPELVTKFGSSGCELSKMVLAAVAANAGGSTFPPISCVPLVSTDTDFGTSDAALTAAETVEAEFLVSPYDAASGTNLDKLKTAAQLMSGAQRVSNSQFGTFGVAANLSVTDPANLTNNDTQFLITAWLRDTAPTQTVAEIASACAAIIAAQNVPFNPMDGIVIPNIDAPASQSDWISVGAGLESESALENGWTPLRVLPNGDVALVRTVTARTTTDGTTPTRSYIDVQDFQVLYYFRRVVYTRLQQPDFRNIKASAGAAKDIKGETIGLASQFEDLTMFQAVAKLAKLFRIQRNESDRSRFDIRVPVNVVPGLHVIAPNIQATTLFDTFTV